MKRIICTIEPFTVNQTIYVFENEVDAPVKHNIPFPKLSSTLMNLAQNNNIDMVTLKGHFTYCNAIKQEVENLTVLKYGETKKITIEVIGE